MNANKLEFIRRTDPQLFKAIVQANMFIHVLSALVRIANAAAWLPDGTTLTVPVIQPDLLPKVKTGDYCKECGHSLYSNSVNIWCGHCDYGKRFPVLVDGAKKSD